MSYKYYLTDLCTICYGKNHKSLEDGNIPVYGSGGLLRHVNKSIYDKPSVLIPRKGSLENVYYVDSPFWTVDTLFWTKVNEKKVYPKYLYYYLKNMNLKELNIGTAVPSLSTDVLSSVIIDLPDIETQNKIVNILSSFDKKFELNTRINSHLEEIVFSYFKSRFMNAEYAQMVGDYVIPKKGKNLLSKDAVLGNVPVVAGGLEPSVYHNKSNTKSPVLTISASGANAGYVRLWHVPVWSSDSSYIDIDIDSNVYFWYVLLKNRQIEIFDKQTGSAQPHIYPKHIAELKISNYSTSDIEIFNTFATPYFDLIGSNIEENKKLAQIRDTLLPKLMSGEIEI